ncbi:MAG: DUF4342 domain-containing protein [Oscillospiraceae bacterium]|nr:DUF4342 domain-containing protein [Oscillospiraceae bacterium]MDD4369171.1 DUF4342 domain-containing protein [Oscillospiraceae bacterium]
MIDLEQVEKLVQKTGVSYEEARQVLTETNGDMLDAVILLERRGQLKPPAGAPQADGFKSDGSHAGAEAEAAAGGARHKEETYQDRGPGFGEWVSRFFKGLGELIHRGNINSLAVSRNGEEVLKLPVTVLVLLLIFAFWLTLPLIIIGLLLGFRFHFYGPDFGRTSVNEAMDKAAQASQKAAENVKQAAGQFVQDLKKDKGEASYATADRNTQSESGTDPSGTHSDH